MLKRKVVDKGRQTQLKTCWAHPQQQTETLRDKTATVTVVMMKAALAAITLLILALGRTSEAVQVEVSLLLVNMMNHFIVYWLKEGELTCRYCAAFAHAAATKACLFLQENGLSFSLEAVKRLQELAQSHGATGQQNPRFRASTTSVCIDPLLPQEFLPLCKQRTAPSSLARLGTNILNLTAHLCDGISSEHVALCV